jgi:hypothetical protein
MHSHEKQEIFHMKKISVVMAMALFGAGATWAQETIPVAEAGVNFSFLNQHPGGDTPSFTSTGGFGTFAYNFNRYFSGVADVGGYHNGSDTNLQATTVTWLFGPRVSLRRGRFTPYVQSLFGGARQWTNFVDPVSGVPNFPTNGFASAYGGGLDIRVNDHFQIKPFQMEYLMTKITNPLSTMNTQNNIRYSGGVIFNLGQK